ncbi:MAG: hypothetical protein WCS03_15475 [Bacteroidota bacterium]
MSLAIIPLILIRRVFLAPYLLAGLALLLIFYVLLVLSFFPDTHPGFLTLFSGAVLLILYSGITWNQFATTLADKG